MKDDKNKALISTFKFYLVFFIFIFSIIQTVIILEQRTVIKEYVQSDIFNFEYLNDNRLIYNQSYENDTINVVEKENRAGFFSTKDRKIYLDNYDNSPMLNNKEYIITHEMKHYIDYIYGWELGEMYKNNTIDEYNEFIKQEWFYDYYEEEDYVKEYYAYTYKLTREQKSMIFSIYLYDHRQDILKHELSK